MISIIIPTYNRAQYLHDLLQSLIAQTEPPNEIVVVDDHSTDNTQHVVQQIQQKASHVRYIKNEGRYQQEAKKTGLKYATAEYIGFLDDDVIIEDRKFLARLKTYLAPHRLVHAKVILENLGRQNESHTRWADIFTTRPWPVLEISPLSWHRGSTVRPVYPLIEFGTFWPARLKPHFIDSNFIIDGYGESYASALRLWRAGIELLLVPELIIRHPGAPTGGSQRFAKMPLTKGFTEFHYGYFHNMIYLHARYWPAWVWLWLPYFLGKATVALMLNRNLRGYYQYALKPIGAATWQYWVQKKYA